MRWAAPPYYGEETAMELVLAVIGLLEKLFGASKALLELLRSGREKEALNNRGRPQHLKEEGRRR